MFWWIGVVSDGLESPVRRHTDFNHVPEFSSELWSDSAFKCLEAITWQSILTSPHFCLFPIINQLALGGCRTMRW